MDAVKTTSTADYFEALGEEERRRGRELLPSELEDFTRAYYAPQYRRDMKGCEDAPPLTYGEGV